VSDAPGNLALALKLQQAHDLLAANKAEQALAVLQRLLPKAAGNPDVNMLMALVSLRLGRLEQAEHFARLGVLGAGATPVNLTNLALVLAARGKRAEALSTVERVIGMQPGHTEAWLTKANLLLEQRRTAEMLRACEEAMKHGPHAQLCVSYGSALSGLGESERAVAFLGEAVARFPAEVTLRGLRAMAIVALWGAEPAAVLAAHKEYGEVVGKIRPQWRAKYAPKKDPDKKIRVGLLSPDLRRHSVAFFIEPLLEHYDRTRMEIVCYSTNRTFDDVSARLKSNATLWRDVSNKIEVQLGDLMSEDRIDIAIDLAGHTDGNSLLAFGLRVAPVQATYCGYPATTGLPQMDWRIVDSLTDPAGADAHATEKLLRLDPCFLCYRPPEEAPEPAPRPGGGGVVFGSFNATRKHNVQTAGLWARVLKAVPGSRLVLKSHDLVEDDVRAMVLARFAAHAVADRVSVLEPPTSMSEHLALYSGIDVALDPLPYHGTTTTCEALWMGVPVVTMPTRMHAGRVGVSLLTNVGAPELIALDEDDYVRVAAELAGDAARLARYRAELRGMMERSPLLDRVGFARRMEAGLREMWRAYCAG
jgi:protein O-GlcNAc transferase